MRASTGNVGVMGVKSDEAQRPRPRRGRPKQDGLADQRRRQIVEAAVVVFAANGYETTTISHLARQAGVGQGTVYRYFDSKRQILDHVVDYSVEQLFEVIDYPNLLTPVDSLDEFVDRLRSVAYQMPELVRRRPELLKMLLVEAGAADVELMNRVLGLEGMMAGAVDSLLGSGQQQGWVRPSVNTEAYGHLLLSLILPGLLQMLQGDTSPETLRRYVDSVLETVRRALLVREVA